MTKEEFLDGLRRALFSTGSEGLIEYNLDYYSSYIDGEIAKGRRMDDIMNELGDPRLIANSIKVAAGYDDVFVGIDNETYENTASKTGNYEENENYSDRKDNSFKTYNFSGNSLIIPIIIAIAVLVVIVAVVAAVFSLCDFDDFVLDEATVLLSAAADSPLLYPYIKNEITKINI